MAAGTQNLPAVEVTPSGWRDVLDAWAAAEQATRGLLLAQGALSLTRARAGLLQDVPANSRIYLATITEEHFRNSFLTMNSGPPADTLAICAERTLSAPLSSLPRDGQKAVDHIDTFEFAHLDRSCFLFAHDLSGPFTILDGTHRFFSGYAALVLRCRLTFTPFQAYVAVSKSPCAVHFYDRPNGLKDQRANLLEIVRRYRTGT